MQRRWNIGKTQLLQAENSSGGTSEGKNEDQLPVDIDTIIFICGFPRIGKSAIANGYIGDTIFNSGPVYDGKVMTKDYKFHVARDIMNDRVLVMDGPGFYHNESNIESNKIIEKGFNITEKFYKINFVMTFDSGLIRQRDIYNINVIMNAIESPEVKYGIIINKLPLITFKFVKQTRKYYRDLITTVLD